MEVHHMSLASFQLHTNSPTSTPHPITTTNPAPTAAEAVVRFLLTPTRSPSKNPSEKTLPHEDPSSLRMNCEHVVASPDATIEAVMSCTSAHRDAATLLIKNTDCVFEDFARHGLLDPVEVELQGAEGDDAEEPDWADTDRGVARGGEGVEEVGVRGGGCDFAVVVHEQQTAVVRGEAQLVGDSGHKDERRDLVIGDLLVWQWLWRPWRASAFGRAWK